MNCLLLICLLLCCGGNNNGAGCVEERTDGCGCGCGCGAGNPMPFTPPPVNDCCSNTNSGCQEGPVPFSNTWQGPGCQEPADPCMCNDNMNQRNFVPFQGGAFSCEGPGPGDNNGNPGNPVQNMNVNNGEGLPPQQ